MTEECIFQGIGTNSLFSFKEKKLCLLTRGYACNPIICDKERCPLWRLK